MTERIIMYGTPSCGDCRRAKQIFEAEKVDYDWIDISQDAEALAYVVEVNKGFRSVPTIVFSDGDVLVEPSSPKLVAKLRGITGGETSSSAHATGTLVV